MGLSVAQRLSIGVKERVLEFLARYGERGYAVLRAAVEATLGSNGRHGVRLGDFNYREVVAKLRSYGLEYNPSNLLSILEREYAVIETSYKSSNQHWWRFLDLEAVIEALDEYERGASPQPPQNGDVEGGVEEPVEADAGMSSVAGLDIGGEIDDPQLEVVRAQIAALDPQGLLRTLRMLASKPRLTSQDRRLFAKIAFEDLEMVASVLEKARMYPDVFAEEIRMLESVLRLASLVARKLMSGGSSGSVARVGIRERLAPRLTGR